MKVVSCAGILVCIGACSSAVPPMDAGLVDASADGAESDAAPFVDAFVPPPRGPLGLNDVSVLFPLPVSAASDELLALSSEGDDGVLLTRDHFDAIEVFEAETEAYERFRVVALRVDPCFPDLAALSTAPSSCRPQLRLVAQPLFDFVDGSSVGASDSAIHLLYDLPASQLAGVVSALVEVADGDLSAPLGVDPVIEREGLSGNRASRLRALVLENCGPSTLRQVTFMRGDDPFTWQFGGFDVRVDGSRRDLERDQTILSSFGPVSVHPTR